MDGWAEPFDPVDEASQPRTERPKEARCGVGLGSATMEEELVGTIAYDAAAGPTGECDAERTGVSQKTRE